MSRSGVHISPECIARFQEMKLNKLHKFIIYKLSDDFKAIEVEEVSNVSEWDFFRDKLLDAKTKSKSGVEEAGPRFAVYDHHYELANGEGSRKKIVFISWCPDVAGVQAKMIYASSKDSLKRTLDGIAIDVQVSDREDIEYDSMTKVVSKGLA